MHDNWSTRKVYVGLNSGVLVDDVAQIFLFTLTHIQYELVAMTHMQTNLFAISNQYISSVLHSTIL